MSSHRLSPSYKAFANQLSFVSIPKNLQDALNNPRWKAAMVEEIEALQKNSTWKLVKLPKDKKTVGYGSIERFKERLVAKGYTQTYGIDYLETFAPVAKINTIRVLLALAANLEWPLQYQSNHTLFLKHSNEGKIIALIVYVDDIVVTGNDTVEMGKLKTYLAKEKYVLDLLVETGMLACKPIDTPIEQNHRLGEDIDDTPVDRERYHTRPDIAYAVKSYIWDEDEWPIYHGNGVEKHRLIRSIP
ncbi:aldose 1-epimerase family protein [Fagus crenata]